MRLLEAHKEMMPKDLMTRMASLLGKEYAMEDKKEEMEPEKEKQEKRDPMKKEDLLDTVPEEFKSQVEQLWKSNQEAVRKAEALEKVLKEETDKRVTREFVQKSKEQYSNIPTECDELAYILKSVHQHDKNLGAKLEGVLKSANEAISKGDLLKEIGTSHAGAVNSVADEVASRAKQMIEKSEDGISFAEAYDKDL